VSRAAKKTDRTSGIAKAPFGHCDGCRKGRRVVRVDTRNLWGKCLGAREPTAPKRLVSLDPGVVPMALQIALGRVMWSVPFRAMMAGPESITLAMPESYTDKILSPQGWEREVADDGRPRTIVAGAENLQVWCMTLASLAAVPAPAPVMTAPEAPPVKTEEAAPSPKPEKGATLADLDADSAAAVGVASLVVQQSGAWELCITRLDGESAKAWASRCKAYTDALGTGDRARLYDGKRRCVWDSAAGTEASPCARTPKGRAA
jgi:hypothetical protein